MTEVDLVAVRAAVDGLARRTPLLPAPALSDRVGAEVWLKAECLQVTGSFKVRGAAARLSALTEVERRRGVVACSSGNHGRAVAWVASRWGIPASVYVPKWVDPVKLAGIRASGADAVLAGESFDDAERRAIADASESGRTYVSAYDDPWVIAGQGTIASEIVEQLGAPPAAVVAPLSGGGLIGGIAAAFAESGGRDARPSHVAVSAENAAVMRASVEAGRPVELPEKATLAGALSGGIGVDNQWSFPLVRDLVDEQVSVSESEIADAMRYAVGRLHLVVEGGGAVGLAALVADRWRPASDGGPVVVVLSGGNVAARTLARVLGGDETA